MLLNTPDSPTQPCGAKAIEMILKNMETLQESWALFPAPFISSHLSQPPLVAPRQTSLPLGSKLITCFQTQCLPTFYLRNFKKNSEMFTFSFPNSTFNISVRVITIYLAT